VYQQEYGPIPKGYNIIHRCRDGMCVNPRHVLAVDRRTIVLWTMAGGRWKISEGVRRLTPKGECGTLPIFLSDVKARQGELTADSLQLTASVGYGIRNTPERLAVSRRPMVLPDALVYELYGLSEDEIRIIEDADSRRLTADSSRLTACGLRLLDIRRGARY